VGSAAIDTRPLAMVGGNYADQGEMCCYHSHKMCRRRHQSTAKFKNPGVCQAKTPQQVDTAKLPISLELWHYLVYNKWNG
jgi:hypothetical protein